LPQRCSHPLYNSQPTPNPHHTTTPTNTTSAVCGQTRIDHPQPHTHMCRHVCVDCFRTQQDASRQPPAAPTTTPFHTQPPQQRNLQERSTGSTRDGRPLPAVTTPVSPPNEPQQHTQQCTTVLSGFCTLSRGDAP